MHSCLMEQTQRSAKAFKFGLRAGSASGCIPLARSTPRKTAQNFASGS